MAHLSIIREGALTRGLMVNNVEVLKRRSKVGGSAEHEGNGLLI